METPLKLARERRGWTKKQAAIAAGIDDSNYHKIESGAATSRETARKIANAFGREVTEMQILYPEDFVPAEAKAS